MQIPELLKDVVSLSFSCLLAAQFLYWQMLLALNPDLLGDKAVCAGVWRTCPALWRSGARLAARVVVSRCKPGFGLGFFFVFDWVFYGGVGCTGFFLAELLAFSLL